MQRVRRALIAVLLISMVALPAPADHPSVPLPDIAGPISGGTRTGEPWYASVAEPVSYGYVEEEFFLTGLAGEPPSAYTTRIHVIRPLDPATFNGTAVVEWANVSAGFDTYPLWATTSDHIVREGFAYVAVSAQKVGVEALIDWDPERYGELAHPGDAASFDIFSQAGNALRAQRAGDPDPMGGLDAEFLIATGASRSAARLRGYLNNVHSHARVFDGFVPVVTGGFFSYGIAPTLLVMSEYETDLPLADGDRFAVWEVAGAPHVGYREFSHDVAVLSRDLTAIEGASAASIPFDRDDAEQYGERGGGPCPRNFMPSGYAYSAAISRMHGWLDSGVQPAPAPRYARDELDEPLRDEHGNTIGGVRLPPIDVPVARYTGQRCDTFGDTIPLDPLTLMRLYPTHASYVAQMRAAAENAVLAGYLVRADAETLIARAEASSIGRVPPIG